MRDMRAHDIDMLTIGQYLQPSKAHLPVARYVHPDTFAMFGREAHGNGFRHAAVGRARALVYHADRQAEGVLAGAFQTRHRAMQPPLRSAMLRAAAPRALASTIAASAARRRKHPRSAFRTATASLYLPLMVDGSRAAAREAREGSRPRRHKGRVEDLRRRQRDQRRNARRVRSISRASACPGSSRCGRRRKTIRPSKFVD